MLRKMFFLIGFCVSFIHLLAQPKQQPLPTTQGPQLIQSANFAYKRLPSGLEYAFIVDKPTAPKPEEGGQISLNMQSQCNNRILYSTAVQFKGKPGVYGVAKPAFKGDLIEAIMLMTPGDSVVCLVDAVALFTNAKSKLPDFIKKGEKVQYFIKLVSVKSKDKVMKEQTAAFEKQMKANMAKQKAEAAKLAVKDDRALQAYFKKNNITPVKTASGLYYTVKEEGSGERAMPNDTVVMNYTGYFMDGKKFDSNEDTTFQHVTPFTFVLGRGAVIRGWGEGIAMLKQGSRATLYIPSGLAYGAQSRPGSTANPRGIPANSILLFDVQLMKVTHPAPPPPPAPKTDTLTKPQVTDTVAPKVESAIPQ